MNNITNNFDDVHKKLVFLSNLAEGAKFGTTIHSNGKTEWVPFSAGIHQGVSRYVNRYLGYKADNTTTLNELKSLYDKTHQLKQSIFQTLQDAHPISTQSQELSSKLIQIKKDINCSKQGFNRLAAIYSNKEEVASEINRISKNMTTLIESINIFIQERSEKNKESVKLQLSKIEGIYSRNLERKSSEVETQKAIEDLKSFNEALADKAALNLKEKQLKGEPLSDSEAKLLADLYMLEEIERDLG